MSDPKSFLDQWLALPPVDLSGMREQLDEQLRQALLGHGVGVAKSGTLEAAQDNGEEAPDDLD